MLFEKNELNLNSKGGSELVAERVLSRLPEELVKEFQITLSRVRNLDENRYRIYWLHDLPFDPELSHLKEQASIDRFHKIVFCGDWQYNQFQSYLNLPYSKNIHVINNGIVPFEYQPKETDTIRLIYASTPHRGLELLVPVFEELAKHFSNVHLDVFSSFNIYGWGERDKQYEALFDRCRNHPQITYHGFQPNEVVREYFQKAHILAYPSIWMECNSLTIAEAMSAGCMVIAPNFGGIVDGTGNLSISYPWVEDKNEHARTFYGILYQAVQNVASEDSQNYLKFVKMYADQRYNIDFICSKWKSLLESVIIEAPEKSLQKSPQSFFQYRVG